MRIFIPVILLLLFFASCQPCKNVHCLNGGGCAENGSCLCINPYTGKNCEINSCDSVICHHGGYCVSGVCDCATGYEGTHCDSLVTTKFAGNFSCTQQCASGSTSYNVSVFASGAPSGCNITFNYLHGVDPVAVVSAYAINIQSQTLPSGETVSGRGRMSADRATITLSMAVTPYGATSGDSCSYTLTRL